jgi:uridine phosphorylase
VAATIHLHPTAELAPRVLLPGDPGRALLLAQALLDTPLMFNHNRGLWGYTGEAGDGEPLTIQSTGMGGPSAAIVVEELADLGARELVRVGTCGAIAPGLDLGELVVAREALAADGTSRALGAGERVAADPGLTAALGGDHEGLAVSTDLFHDPDAERAHAAWLEAGALVIEMEAAAIFQVAARRGLRAACVLAVTDVLAGGERRRIDDEGYVAAGERLGRVAAAALAS